LRIDFAESSAAGDVTIIAVSFDECSLRARLPSFRAPPARYRVTISGRCLSTSSVISRRHISIFALELSAGAGDIELILLPGADFISRLSILSRGSSIYRFELPRAGPRGADFDACPSRWPIPASAALIAELLER
jgi:hypothetical protein